MKRFMKLSVITLLAVMLLDGGSLLAYAQEEQSATQQNSSEKTLQEAQSLVLEGSRTFNMQLIQQAKDKYTLWLNANSDNANKKMVAEVLRSRASVSRILNEPEAAMADYQESIKYDPIGEVQLGLCLYYKNISADSIESKTCYQKAVNMFSNKQRDKADINYLIARILSGDNAAIVEYKNLVDSTEDPHLLFTYQMAAQEYFGANIYQKIYGH